MKTKIKIPKDAKKWMTVEQYAKAVTMARELNEAEEEGFENEIKSLVSSFKNINCEKILDVEAEIYGNQHNNDYFANNGEYNYYLDVFFTVTFKGYEYNANGANVNERIKNGYFEVSGHLSDIWQKLNENPLTERFYIHKYFENK